MLVGKHKSVEVYGEHGKCYRVLNLDDHSGWLLWKNGDIKVTKMQCENIKIDGDLCLPTAHMKIHCWENMINFYLDEGQLHRPHGDCENAPVFFIEVAVM